MPKKVRKTFGENPETVTVLTTQVAFDENGNAVVEDEIADVLEQIPGYAIEAVIEESPASEDHKDEIVQDDITSIDELPSEEDNEDDTDNEEEDEEVPVKPSKPARARKSPSRK